MADNFWDDPSTWASPGQSQASVVTAHTPDDSKYHLPDDRQGMLMHAGVRGGTVIPRDRGDGVSKGFDGRVADVVHVDPDAPDGGAIVDLRGIDQNKLSGALSSSRYAHEVFYRLGSSAQNFQQEKQAVAQPRSNPHVSPGTYITPSSNSSGLPVYSSNAGSTVQPLPSEYSSVSPAPVTATPAVSPSNSPSPVIDPYQQSQPQQSQPQQPQPQQPQPQYQPQYQPQPQPQHQQSSYEVAQLQRDMAHLTNVVGSLAETIARQQSNPVPPASTPPAVSCQVEPTSAATFKDEPQPMQYLKDVEDASKSAKKEGMILGFETLDMPFVSGPLPVKARCEVFFELPGMGTMSAKYHSVSVGAGCLALVYDTRFEDGNQYLPPDLGDQVIRVSIPKQDKYWLCSSLGIHFNVGVLDIVILIVNQQQETSELE